MFLASPQMTVFVALVAMDAERQKAGKMDWCCCFTNKSFLEQVLTTAGAIITENLFVTLQPLLSM